MSQDVAGKMLKPDFDMEVSGLVYGFLFREGHQPLQITSQQVCSRFTSWTVKMISSGCILISTTQPPRSG